MTPLRLWKSACFNCSWLLYVIAFYGQDFRKLKSRVLRTNECHEDPKDFRFSVVSVGSQLQSLNTIIPIRKTRRAISHPVSLTCHNSVAIVIRPSPTSVVVTYCQHLDNLLESCFSAPPACKKNTFTLIYL